MLSDIIAKIPIVQSANCLSTLKSLALVIGDWINLKPDLEWSYVLFSVIESFQLMLRKQDHDILICDAMHLTFNTEPSLRIKGEKQKKQKGPSLYEPLWYRGSENKF